MSTPSLFGLLKPYKWAIVLLVVFTLVSNALNLWLPKILSKAIDSYMLGSFSLGWTSVEFFIVAICVFVTAYLQAVVQVYSSERVARDLRNQLSSKISVQDYIYVQKVGGDKLLTNLTSDIDNIKTFVSMAIASLISSLFLIIGASVLLLLINWKLALAVLTIIPIIGGSFFVVLTRVRKLFTKSQEAIDWLNKVISESILGSALIRVVNSNQPEFDKFVLANTEQKNIGMQILRMFAALIPTITFVASMATLVILALGGHFVIQHTMTLGEFAAFNSYVVILIFPILILGFTSNVIAQAQASFARISEILYAPDTRDPGTVVAELRGDIEVKNVSLNYGDKVALKDVSFRVKGGTKTAIIGPTAAGKTQLLYLLTALTQPETGSVLYDGVSIAEYDKHSFYSQVGFVFQDSSIFNLTVRENIAFSTSVTDADLKKAVDTAELADFIDQLPLGLDTVVSERGTSLSGGQKQRIMLARALALNPKVLLLDDFTARVDTRTEQKILSNVAKNYPDLTLISVTQKISSIEAYDQVVVLMEGEVLATGTHAELMETSPEYVQMNESQKSLNKYELQA